MSRKLTSQSRVEKPVLSEIEKVGAPEAIASIYCHTEADSSQKPIGPPRASSIYDCCVRFHSIGFKCNYPEYRYVNVSSRVTFSLGNSIHTWIQNTPDVLGDKRTGWWRCQACRHTFWGTAPSGYCLSCGAPDLVLSYREHNLHTLEPYPSSGHPDMFIKVEDKYRVVEIKTIAGEAFDKLFAPLVEHRWQIQHYMWGCSEDQQIPVEVDPLVGYILYVSKKPSWKTLPYKMFVEVKSNDILKKIKGKLKEFHSSLANPSYCAPLQECVDSDFTSTKAKWCSVKKYCAAFHEAGQ